MDSLAHNLRRTLLRPAGLQKVFVRHAASTRRHTKLLRLHPHPSMILTATSPRTDHIVYNPPSSAPTPLITPTLFLPKDDPRRELFATSTTTSTTAAAATAAALKPDTEAKELPPPLREPYEKTYHLTLQDCKRMRALRNSSPAKWHRNALAKEFNCSTLFVGMVCQASDDRLKLMALRADRAKSRWGTKRALAREERAKRRAGWGGADGL